MSPINLWDQIPAIYKIVTIFVVLVGIGFTAGGATVSLTSVPERLENLEKVHREDIAALKEVTQANKAANETSNQKLDRVICLLEAQSGLRNAIQCAN